MSFKDTPTVKMTKKSSLNATLQPMSNESIETTHRLLDSHEEHFKQPNPGHLAAMCAHPLFSGIGFDELKTMREDTGDGQELMKKVGKIFTDAMNKTVEAISSLVGSAISDLSTGKSLFEKSSIVPPSSRLN